MQKRDVSFERVVKKVSFPTLTLLLWQLFLAILELSIEDFMYG